MTARSIKHPADDLWPRAERIARRRCAHTLALLRGGAGGFYDHDDMMQDLYLEFRDTVEACQRRLPQGAVCDEAMVWREWSRRLFRGGSRIIRRKPQRLWALQRVAIEPTPPRELEQVIDPADPPGARPRMRGVQVVQRVEDALWSLAPLSRQLLYLVRLRGLALDDALRDLHLTGQSSARDLIDQGADAVRRSVDASR